MTTNKYVGFETTKGDVERKKIMKMLDERIKEKLDEPMKRVEVFETRNMIHFINQNLTSVVQFYSRPVKFTLGWLDGIDAMIRSISLINGN